VLPGLISGRALAKKKKKKKKKKSMWYGFLLLYNRPPYHML
jgi:hypothetical protein